MINKKITSILLILVVIFVFCPAIYAEDELSEGYFTIYEEGSDKKIFCTSRVIHVGDQYLNEDNIMYEVVEVSEDKAYARFKEKVEIERALDMPRAAAMAQGIQDNYNTLNIAKSTKEKKIVLYHTHSDESYIPTDGKSSIPNHGGIYKVGAALKAALEKKGITVIQSQQSHDPHDAMAYQRSRRTATELLKQGPDAVIDVHRDAVPAEEYQTELNGRPLSKMQLVVGRQNPQMSTINNFAWQLKATADKKYPGLIKGIFYGQGGYNQDLFPRSILIEAGTYTNSRYWAEDGANIMADVIATTLYGADHEKKITPGGGGTTQIPGEGKGAAKTLLWIIGIAAVGFGAYLLISTGGINELSSKVKQFTGKEFANFLGNQRTKRIDNDKNHDPEEKKENEEK